MDCSSGVTLHWKKNSFKCYSAHIKQSKQSEIEWSNRLTVGVFALALSVRLPPPSSIPSPPSSPPTTGALHQEQHCSSIKDTHRRRSWLIAEDVLFPIGGNISPKLVLTLRWPITAQSVTVKLAKLVFSYKQEEGHKLADKLLPRSTNGLRISSPSSSVNVPESSKLNLHQSRSNKLLLQEQLIVWFGLHSVCLCSQMFFQCTWLLGKLKIKLIKYTNAKFCAQWCCELPIEETNECEWGKKWEKKEEHIWP